MTAALFLCESRFMLQENPVLSRLYTGSLLYLKNRGRNRMKKALIILLAAAAAAAVLFFWTGDGLTLSVQATVRVPTKDPYYVENYDGYKNTWIKANEQAYVSSGEHGAPYRGARMRGGTLVTGMGYGPISVKGAIDASRLMNACPGLRLEKDWEYIISIYNTSDNNKTRLYLDLEIFADTLKARQTLYVFYEGYAHPMIKTEELKIGEMAGFAIEL